MPLVPTAMTGFIITKASSKLISGEKLSYFVSAISSGTCQYILSASIVNTTNIALGPGAGTQTGKVTSLVASKMSSSMSSIASGQGLAGRDIKKLFDAISFGVVNAMKAVLLQGTIIGAGPGTGNGKITGLVPAALQNLIYPQMELKQISGDKLRTLLFAISSGICNHIMSAGTVTATDIGVAATPPVGPITIPAAPGIGKLV